MPSIEMRTPALFSVWVKMVEVNWLPWESVADYVQEITEETTEIPDHLRGYIDFDSMARDMELNGDIFTVELDGEVHIFANR